VHQVRVPGYRPCQQQYLADGPDGSKNDTSSKHAPLDATSQTLHAAVAGHHVAIMQGSIAWHLLLALPASRISCPPKDY
jgi:hypothetical protein